MKRGAALPAVILALTLTSALAVGGAFVARQHAAMARVSLQGIELLPAAEEALVNAIARWDTATMDAQPVGNVMTFPVREESERRVEVWATRTGRWQFWLVAQATSGVRPVLRRRLGVVVTTSTGVPRLSAGRGWAELP
jgi:hypothetical protein